MYNTGRVGLQGRAASSAFCKQCIEKSLVGKALSGSGPQETVLHAVDSVGDGNLATPSVTPRNGISFLNIKAHWQRADSLHPSRKVFFKLT